MKDEKAQPGGFGPDYVGWAVPIIATAYVMANTYEEAQFKVNRGLRMQARIMFTRIETLRPVQVEKPETIENSPLPTFTRTDAADLRVVDLMAKQADEGLMPVESVVYADAKPPCTFCDAHRRNIYKRVYCTPAQECHADYWCKAMKGAK